MTVAVDHDASLSHTCRAEHGHVVAALSGDLGITSAPALREHFLSLLRPAAAQLIVDLSAVERADASGLAVLVGSGRRAGLLGGYLRLAAPSAEVARVLAATGIDRRLDTFPTVRAAIAGRLAPGQPAPARSAPARSAPARSAPARPAPGRLNHALGPPRVSSAA